MKGTPWIKGVRLREFIKEPQRLGGSRGASQRTEEWESRVDRRKAQWERELLEGTESRLEWLVFNFQVDN